MSSPSRRRFPRFRKSSSASGYARRFRGSAGRFGSTSRRASSALHSARTRSIAASTAPSRNGKKSSCRSIQETSPSNEVNSVTCRTVSDGSARKAGAISYTRSSPRHEHLLVQLGALTQERAASEVVRLEQSRASFRARAGEFRGLDLDEALVV